MPHDPTFAFASEEERRWYTSIDEPRPQINVALLRKTIEHIEEHPQEWHQGNWRCQSGMCFAGTAAALDGGRWISGPRHPHAQFLALEDDEIGADGEPLAELVDALDVEDFCFGGKEVVAMTAGARAQRRLGLTRYEASVLFDADNTLADLKRLVDRLIEAGERQLAS